MLKRKSRWMRNPYTAFDVINYLILSVVVIVTLYPILNTLAISLNEGIDTMTGGITIFPRKFTLRNYEAVFKDPAIINSFLITVLRTLIGAVTSLLATSLLAYGLTKKELIGRKFYMALVVGSMYFSGGLIPTYILIYNLGFIDNFLVFIIPNMVGAFNVIIMMTAFRQVPKALEESAKIDGAGLFRTYFQIVMPVSIAVVATITLFNAVFHWNSWFDGYLYITKEELLPLQNILVRIINQNNMAQAMGRAGSAAGTFIRKSGVTVKSVNMATMMISMIPIFIVYPFLQKYFIKGIMIGSVKG